MAQPRPWPFLPSDGLPAAEPWLGRAQALGDGLAALSHAQDDVIGIMFSDLATTSTKIEEQKLQATTHQEPIFYCGRLGPGSHPKGSGTTVGFMWANSQGLATILDPFQIILVILGWFPYLRLQHLSCLNSKHLSQNWSEKVWTGPEL